VAFAPRFGPAIRFGLVIVYSRLLGIIAKVKIYTRTGDAGETALFDGSRVSKADPRVDAYGHIDELNAVLGQARAAGLDAELDGWIERLQRDLFALGAQLADPASRIAPRVTKAVIGPQDTARLETWIDQAESELAPLRRFVLPAGAPAGAALHLARTVCRRAERHIVSLGVDAVDTELLAYVNRLSDLLFVLARLANARVGVPDQEW
jgi:cob(I)alamin adenosyltransferase